MKKILSVASILALASAMPNPFSETEPVGHPYQIVTMGNPPRQFYQRLDIKGTTKPGFVGSTYKAADDEFFVDFAHDDEQMIRTDNGELRNYYHNIPLYRQTPRLDIVHDDEMMIRTDNGELRDYHHRISPYRKTPIDIIYDDEMMIRTDNGELRNYYHHTSPFRQTPHLDIVNDDEMMIRTDNGELRDYHHRISPYRKSPALDVVYDDELFTAGKAEGKVHEDIKKSTNHVSQHPEVIKKAHKENKNVYEILKKLQDKKNGAQTSDDHLPVLRKLIKEGRTLQKNVKPSKPQTKPVEKEEVHDNNLSIKEKAKEAANWVGDHPKVISETAKAIKTLRGGK